MTLKEAESNMALNNTSNTSELNSIVGNLMPCNVTNVLFTNEECLSDEDYLLIIEAHVFPQIWEWVLAGFYILTFLIGTTGNFLVCFAVWRNRTMRTVTNIFIVNLAVADLLIILVCLTPTLVSDITETWFVGFAMCKIVMFLVVSKLLRTIDTYMFIRGKFCFLVVCSAFIQVVFSKFQWQLSLALYDLKCVDATLNKPI